MNQAGGVLVFSEHSGQCVQLLSCQQPVERKAEQAGSLAVGIPDQALLLLRNRVRINATDLGAEGRILLTGNRQAGVGHQVSRVTGRSNNSKAQMVVGEQGRSFQPARPGARSSAPVQPPARLTVKPASWRKPTTVSR